MGRTWQGSVELGKVWIKICKIFCVDKRHGKSNHRILPYKDLSG